MKRLRAAEVVPIREAVDAAVVRIVGRVEYVRRALRAPLSGRECACFHFVVEQLGPVGSLVPDWNAVVDAVEHDAFLVRDETGVMLVRPRASTLVLVKDKSYLSGAFEDPSPAMEALLARHGQSMVGPGGITIWTRYREGVLEAGEKVGVLGRVGLEPDPDLRAPGGGYRGRAMRTVLLDPGQWEPMLISDEPKAIR